MQPFTKQQLATPEDFKYRGYIPVNHSIFSQDNTFTGTVNATENVPNIVDVPRAYIDEAEDPEWNNEPPTTWAISDLTRTVLTPSFAPTLVPGTDFIKPDTFTHIFYEEPVEEVIVEQPVFRAPQAYYNAPPQAFYGQPQFYQGPPQAFAPQPYGPGFAPSFAPSQSFVRSRFGN